MVDVDSVGTPSHLSPMPYLTNVERLTQGVVGSVQPEEGLGAGEDPRAHFRGKAPVSPPAKPLKPKPRRRPAPTGSEASKGNRKKKDLVLAAGDKFPKRPKRFDQVIDEKGDTWVYDLPRNEDGEWMDEGPDGEDVLMDWHLRTEEEAPRADSERSEEE